MKTEELRVEAIVVGPDHRGVLPEAVNMLAKSIKEIGLTHPIAVRRLDGDRLYLIAGRQRLEAHKQLKRATIQAIIFDDEDIQAKRREHHENLWRANLTPAQEALAHHELKQLHEAEHPETKPVRERGGPGRGKKNDGHSGRGFPTYSADAAKKTGKSERTTRRQTRRAEVLGGRVEKLVGTAFDAPEQLDALVELTLADPAVAESLIEKAAVGEKVDAKLELKRYQRAAREATMNPPAPLGEAFAGQRFGVIYADPPWPYESWSEKGRDRTPDNHYPLMEEAEIAALPVAEKAARNCVLFLWTTVPQAAMAHRVIEAWGFTYRSQWVWDKVDIAMGHWARNRHEVLMIATRGDVVAPAPGEQPESIICEKL
jgi:hypothetical protein